MIVDRTTVMQECTLAHVLLTSCHGSTPGCGDTAWCTLSLPLQVQTIGFLSHLRSKGVHGPFMVVGPLSTLPNWVSEFARWCPSMPCILYHGNKAERQALRSKRMPSGAPPFFTAPCCTKREAVTRSVGLARCCEVFLLVAG